MIKNKNARKYFQEMLDYILCVELDLNVAQCKLNGEWPNNEESLPHIAQQTKECTTPADYEYCPHCRGSFSFAKLDSDFKCKWCKKDVRTNGR